VVDDAASGTVDRAKTNPCRKPPICAAGSLQGTRRVPLPVLSDSISEEEMDLFVENATTASNFLKAISHEGRLLILCHLVSGEKSVTELEELLSARQAAVSQQLSRLRLEGLVIPRRDGKVIYYRLADDRPKRILEVVYDLFCADDAQDKAQADK
jgi:ArsR family transcriptional regulator